MVPQTDAAMLKGSVFEGVLLPKELLRAKEHSDSHEPGRLFETATGAAWWLKE